MSHTYVYIYTQTQLGLKPGTLAQSDNIYHLYGRYSLKTLGTLLGTV